MLGSFTFVGTLVHPMKAAEQFAVIDRLSGGRLVTTVSRGFLAPFWGQFGVPEGRMLGRFQETLRIWRRAMAGERFDFEGEHWQVARRRACARGGGWPLWGGGNAAPAAIRRSGRVRRGLDVATRCRRRRAWDAKAGSVPRAGARARQGPVRRAHAGRVGGRHARRRARGHRHRTTPHGRLLSARSRHRGARTARDLSAYMAGRYRRRVHRAARAAARGRRRRLRRLLLPPLDGPVAGGHAASRSLRFGEEVVAPVHAKYPAPDHPAIPPACRV